MIKNVFFGLIFLGTLALYADICNTSGLTTRTQVHAAQQCLKQEIKKSIDLAEDYNTYHIEVLEALQYYSDLKIMCKRLEISRRYSKWNKNYYTKKLNRKNRERQNARISLRRLENQYGYISTRYSKFKEQIRQLEYELELLEIDYRKILN